MDDEGYDDFNDSESRSIAKEMALEAQYCDPEEDEPCPHGQ